MILYHYTDKSCLDSIMHEGLKPNGMGIIYLTPNLKSCPLFRFGDVLLWVETGNAKLTAFEDCKDWEVLCWNPIPPENITLVMVKETGTLLPDFLYDIGFIERAIARAIEVGFS